MLHNTGTVMIMIDDPETCALSTQHAELVAQLSGIIFLAHVAWRLPAKRLPHMARIFHFVGETDQAAALATRTGLPAQLRINYKDICE
jgi:hypothetical protein